MSEIVAVHKYEGYPVPKWNPIDLSQFLSSDFYESPFRYALELILGDGTKRYVSTDTLDESKVSSGNIEIYFNTLSDDSLTHTDLDSLVTYVQHHDLRALQYNIDRVDRDRHVDGESLTRLLDIKVSGPDLNWRDVDNNGLCMVDGKIKETISSTEALYILDGVVRNTTNELKSISFLDFRDLGGIHKYPLYSRYISIYEGTRLFTGLSIDTSSLVDTMEGKTPVLILNGDLVFLEDGVFEILDEHTLKLRLNVSAFPARILHDIKSKRIDILSHEDIVNDPIEIETDEFIQTLFNNEDTFLAFIPSEDIKVSYRHLPALTLSDNAILTSEPPVLPIINDIGSLHSYTTVSIAQRYRTTIDNSYRMSHSSENDVATLPFEYPMLKNKAEHLAFLLIEKTT